MQVKKEPRMAAGMKKYFVSLRIAEDIIWWKELKAI